MTFIQFFSRGTIKSMFTVQNLLFSVSDCRQKKTSGNFSDKICPTVEIKQLFEVLVSLCRILHGKMKKETHQPLRNKGRKRQCLFPSIGGLNLRRNPTLQKNSNLRGFKTTRSESNSTCLLIDKF